MITWEYAILDCQATGSHVHPRFLNGQELKDWQKLRLSEMLNRLGSEGWELVHFTQMPPITAGQLSSGMETWVFKRPRPAAPRQEG